MIQGEILLNGLSGVKRVSQTQTIILPAVGNSRIIVLRSRRILRIGEETERPLLNRQGAEIFR